MKVDHYQRYWGSNDHKTYPAVFNLYLGPLLISVYLPWIWKISNHWMLDGFHITAAWRV